MRILLVEDAADLSEAIVESFARSGLPCDAVHSIAAARDHLDVQRYDAVVLDVNLPDGSGLALMQSLRREGRMTPVLILTARFAVDDRVSALDRGADDYLVKPFDLRELQARLRALIRRDQADPQGRIEAGDMVFDPAARSLRVRGAAVRITRREMTLLEVFCRNRGRVLPKERLFDSLFSFDEVEVGMNAVELYVARLRKKLAGSGMGIETHRGLGYSFDAIADAPR